jgi:plasmid stabilization system protein ParE
VFTVIFTQAARRELIDAQDWYEREAAGLGRHFREAIDALTERLSANPQQCPIVFKNVRRALLRRFPCALFSRLKAIPFLLSGVSMPAAIRCIGKSALEFYR